MRSTGPAVIVAVMGIVSGCGGRGVATARGAPASTAACNVDGTWAVTWSPSPSIEVSEWSYSRERTLTIEPDTIERLRPGVRTAEMVQVDRTRCLIHVVAAAEFTFSDDAGGVRENLTLDLAIHGDTGVVSGRYQIDDWSMEPPLRHDAVVTGTVRRPPVTDGDPDGDSFEGLDD